MESLAPNLADITEEQDEKKFHAIYTLVNTH